MEFTSLYSHGFARVAACTLPVALADPGANADRIIEQARLCHDDGAAVALFPELSVSGYSLDDLLLQDVLLDAVDAAIVKIAEETADLMPLVVVGAPIANDRRLYNCAVVIQRGNILGVVPKSYLPNYREFYEKRHFAEAAGAYLAPLIRPHWPTAVDDPEIYGGEWPPGSITDLVFIANLVSETRNPFSPEEEDVRKGLARAATLGLDEALLATVLAESVAERQALIDLFRIG